MDTHTAPAEPEVQSAYRKCAVCSHEWVRRGPDPARCPNNECRSKRWFDGKDRRLIVTQATESGEILRSMYGYAVRSTVTGMTKIGVSRNIPARLSSYRTHCHEPVELAYAAKFESETAAREWESAVLELYGEHLSHGEWLSPNIELESDISVGVILNVPSTEIEKVRSPFQAFTVRMPTSLYTEFKNAVVRQRANGSPKLSMQEWLLDAADKYLAKCESERNPVQISAPKISENSGFPTRSQVFAEVAATRERLSSKPSAAEVAAQYGIKTLATIEEVEPRLDAESGYIQPTIVAVQEHMPSRNWGKFYAAMDEMEPTEAKYEFDQATAEINLPVGFLKMPKQKQIAWLNGNA